MTKQEIEQAIKNGESVWCSRRKKIQKINFKDTIPYFDNYKIEIKIEDENGVHYETCSINNLFKTKAEAEHYLHHANVTRTETLPFLTWEEFLESKNISFTSKSGIGFLLEKTQESIVLWMKNLVYSTYELTEQNFYKAYDECVRLFKGGE